MLVGNCANPFYNEFNFADYFLIGLLFRQADHCLNQAEKRIKSSTGCPRYLYQ